jgi:hypothetical protein
MAEVFYIPYNKETGEAQSPFGDSLQKESSSPMEIREGTIDDLREVWNSGSMALQQQFESFDQYVAYMREASDMLSQQAWWESEGADTRTPSQRIREGEDLATGMMQAQPDDLRQSQANARKSSYQQWLMSDQNQALLQKYGIEPVYYNQDGDQFVWTGAGYVKTVKVDDHAGFNDYVKAAIAITIGTGLGVGVSNALTAASTAATSAATAAGSSMATSLGVAQSTISAAIGGMAGSAITQTLLTGEINPADMFKAGLTAGIIDLAGTFGAGQYADVDASAFNAATSGPMVAMNEKLWEIADALGTDFDTALDIVKGVAIGTIDGKGLEGILTGAVTTLGADYVTNYIADTYGTLVPNFFREGTTEINPDSIEEMSRVFIRDFLNGDIDEGTLLSMGLGYIREDGTFAFADPRWGMPESDFWGEVADLFPDVDLMGGAGWDIRFLTDEEKEANQAIAGVIDEANEDNLEEGFKEQVGDQANIILQYDQETIDKINQYLEEVKQAGRDFDDEVLQPVKDIIVEAGYAIDENVLQPIKDGAKWLWDQLPSLPEGPDLPKGEGVDADLPGFDLPGLKFKGSKPFGTDLKAFTPFSPDSMAQPTQLIPKVQTRGFDPRSSGAGIVSSLFSEYIG